MCKATSIHLRSSHALRVAAVAILAWAANASSADARAYRLLAGSTITDDCWYCDRIPFVRPLSGTFTIAEVPATFGLYEVTDIAFTSMGDDPQYTVEGKGTYYQNSLEKPVQEMNLTVTINGAAGIELPSGVVGIESEWPVIDITVTETTERDLAHKYSLRIRAAPEAKAYVPYQLVAMPGENVEKGSYFIDDCPICGKPTVIIPIEGTFTLGEIEETPNYVTIYRIDDIDFTSMPEFDEYDLTGGGIYRYGGHLAILQSASLLIEVVIPGLYTESGAILFADSEPVPATLPAIDILLKHKNPLSEAHVYTLHIVAEPQKQETFFRRGNANADDDINIADAVYTLSYLFASAETPPCEKALDSNGDGDLNIADPIALLGYLFGGVLTLPEPFASCGVDPQSDELTCEAFPPCGR
jgi:hypothetical protein